MGGQHLELEVDQRLQQAGLDQPALAGDAAPAQLGENALRSGGAPRGRSCKRAPTALNNTHSQDDLY